ncbi:MAG: hypothetical protein ACR2MG_12070 [Pyrinomonadaceae bacterium]
MKQTSAKIAAILILTMCFSSAAMAQTKSDETLALFRFYTGVETSAGTLDVINTMRWGNTFTLTGFSEWDTETHCLTVSLNYFNSLPEGGGFTVLGGTWSLVVFRDEAYAGTLYGEVTGGAITFIQNADGETIAKQIKVKLRTTGGTGVFAKRKFKSVNGIYSAATNFKTNQTTGNLNLNY